MKKRNLSSGAWAMLGVWVSVELGNWLCGVSKPWVSTPEVIVGLMGGVGGLVALIVGICLLFGVFDD